MPTIALTMRAVLAYHKSVPHCDSCSVTILWPRCALSVCVLQVMEGRSVAAAHIVCSYIGVRLLHWLEGHHIRPVERA